MATQPQFGWFASADHLRAWAYDEEMELSDQDEDLLVYAIECLPTLLECAVDEHCPKRDYIIQCIDYSLRNLALKGREFEELREAVNVIETFGGGLDPNWIFRLRKRLETRTKSRRIENKAEAIELGEWLLFGIGVTGDIAAFDIGEVWTIERSYGCSFIEAISISKRDGEVQYLGYWANGFGPYRPRSL